MAETALRGRFRQTKALTSRDFAQHLAKRGVDVSEHDLHFLAAAGVVRPLVSFRHDWVEQDGERWREVRIGQRHRTFVDPGVLPPESVRYPNLRDFDRLDRPSALWHPFQLWPADRVSQFGKLQLNTLSGGEANRDWLADHAVASRQALIDWAQSPEVDEFQRVLAVLLTVEPLVVFGLRG